MSGTISFWLNRIRTGDSTAVEPLWRYFAPKLMRRISGQCRQLRIRDEEDIVSVAFFQLTTAMQENKFESITGRKEFWRLLHVISKRKLRDSLRYERAVCRGGESTVVSIEAIPPSAVPAVPDEAAKESLDDDSLIGKLYEVVGKMDRDEFSTIIRLKVNGLTNAEVARELGISLRTTQYLIQEIKNAWISSFRGSKI